MPFFLLGLEQEGFRGGCEQLSGRSESTHPVPWTGKDRYLPKDAKLLQAYANAYVCVEVHAFVYEDRVAP